MIKSHEKLPGSRVPAHVNSRTGVSSSPGGDRPASSNSRDCLLEPGNLCIQEDDKCKTADSVEKKKRVSRIVGGGLRQFSFIVCKKIESKGRTTYSEVADEIIAEFVSQANENSTLTPYDEKNIRRRVYDAFNVLLAIDVIAREKKEIKWIGFPDIRHEWEELVEERITLLARIQEKVKYSQELEEQFVGRKNLMLRNRQVHKSDNVSHDGIALPFILVQTHPHATVEIEISEDRRLVHFDFNGEPFAMHDDAHVLKEMRQYQAAAEHHDTANAPDLRSNRSFGAATFSWSAETTGMA